MAQETAPIEIALPRPREIEGRREIYIFTSDSQTHLRNILGRGIREYKIGGVKNDPLTLQPNMVRAHRRAEEISRMRWL